MSYRDIFNRLQKLPEFMRYANANPNLSNSLLDK
jgi:hypothetical protein